MRLIRILAAAAMIMSSAPAGIAAVAPDNAMPLHLIRGGGGGHGGGFAGHVGGFRGGFAVHRGWGYRPRAYRYGFYPYAYACPYPYAYSYAYCGFPG
jgi:hypothetical protein